MTWTSTGNIHWIEFGDFQAKGSKDIERTAFVKRPAVLPLGTFQQRVIYSPGASIVPSLKTFKLMVKRYWMDNIFFQKPAVWLWPKNKWGTSTPKGRPLFQVWQLSSKGVKNNERTSLCLQTDWCKTICPLFSSPELKDQVSFSDCLSSVVCPSVRLSVCLSVNFFLFSTSSQEPLGQF